MTPIPPFLGQANRGLVDIFIEMPDDTQPSISDRWFAVDRKVYAPALAFNSSLAVLAPIEPVGPTLPQPPAKRHATSYSHGLISQSNRPCAPTPLSTSLPLLSTLACRPSAWQPILQVPSLSSQLSASLALAVPLLLPFRFSGWSGCRSASIPGRRQRSDPTFA